MPSSGLDSFRSLRIAEPLYRGRSRHSLEVKQPHSRALSSMPEYARASQEGMLTLLRLEYALELVLYMLSQHHAIGLQTDCMVTVLAPVVEAARLPRVCPMALGYGLPPL